MGYGVASAEFAGAIYISIAARVLKLFRDSFRPQNINGGGMRTS